MNWQDPQAVQKFQAAEEVIRRQAPPRTLAVCRRCGVMPWKDEFLTWPGVQQAAQEHANAGGKGHVIAATFVMGATIRPQEPEEEEPRNGVEQIPGDGAPGS